MKKDSFILYVNHFKNLEFLSMEERGILLTAIIKHLNGEKQENLPPMVIIMLQFITDQIDRDRASYGAMCERNAKNGVFGVLGGRPKKSIAEHTATEFNAEELNNLLKVYPQIKNDCDNIENVDFKLLACKIRDSEFLKSVCSLKWLVNNYDKIISDYYKTFKSKAFDSQRTYSNDDLNGLIDNINDL